MKKLPKIFAALSLSLCCLLGVVGCKNDAPDEKQQTQFTTEEQSECPKEDGKPKMPKLPKEPIEPLPKREPRDRLPFRPFPRPRPTDGI